MRIELKPQTGAASLFIFCIIIFPNLIYIVDQREYNTAAGVWKIDSRTKFRPCLRYVYLYLKKMGN